MKGKTHDIASSAGHDVRVLARRQSDTQPQVTFVTGDLRRGEGIDPAVRGAGVVIHCATRTKGDAEATRNLVKAVARAASPHFGQPPIVGIDAMTAWGYLKAKLEVERIVENSGLPWTILRVTQFYNYCFENARKLAKFPLVAPVPGGFRPAGRRGTPNGSGPGTSSWLRSCGDHCGGLDPGPPVKIA